MMKRTSFLKAIVAMALIAALLCGGAMAASLDAKVVTSKMKVYSSVDDGAKLIGMLRRGASIKVLSTSEDMAKISYKGKTGYAPLKSIMFDKHVKVVSTKATPIKFATKKSYKRNTYYTGTLSAGVTLYVAGVNGDKYLVCNESGSAIGYVAKSALKKAE